MADRGRSGDRPRGSSLVLWLVFLGGLAGAALLVVAEFTTLFTIHSSAYGAPVHTVRTGPHHSYALIPIAVLAGLLTIVGVRTRSRPALVGLGILGLVTLGIALIGDLPDAHATGFVGHPQPLTPAKSTPSTGLYLETLGGIVLLITAGAALLLPDAPRRRVAAGSAPAPTTTPPA